VFKGSTASLELVRPNEIDRKGNTMADETNATPQAAAPAAAHSAPSSSEPRPYTPRPAYAGPGGPRPPRPAGGPGGGPGGPGGPGGGGRKFFRRKKVCKFCTEKIDAISYRDVRLLQGFVAERGKIVPRRLTGVCTRHQRKVSAAIKQSRNIALIAFAARF
jgi:small subunit ribosomal protein S18